MRKQNLLTAIIIILFIALFIMIGSIVYEEKINMSKEPVKQTTSTSADEIDTEIDEGETSNSDNVEVEDEKEEEESPVEDNNSYIGEEENNAEDSTKSNDEKAIELVKNEWGDDDTVTFSIEQKNGTKYYVAVKNANEPTVWYEVDIETWEVSEY